MRLCYGEAETKSAAQRHEEGRAERSHMTQIRRRTNVVALVALGFILAGWRPGPALATEALVSLSPEEATIALGATLDVAVVVSDVTGLYGLDVRLAFDPTVLEVVDLDPSRDGIQMQAGEFLHPDFVVKNEADNGDGSTWYAITQLNPREPASGSGTVVTVRFRAKAPGATPLVPDVTLSDREGIDIYAGVTGGEYTVTAQQATPTQSSPTPAASSTSTPQPSATTQGPSATPAGTVPTAPTRGSPTATAQVPTLTGTPLAPGTPTATNEAYPYLPSTAEPTAPPTAQAESPSAGPASPTTPPKGPSATAKALQATSKPVAPTAAPQAMATAAKMAVVLPTEEPTRPAAAQRQEEPLIPQELFICLVVLLLVVTIVLFLYLIRRPKRAPH